jgi:hypothetical protein
MDRVLERLKIDDPGARLFPHRKHGVVGRLGPTQMDRALSPSPSTAGKPPFCAGAFHPVPLVTMQRQTTSSSANVASGQVVNSSANHSRQTRTGGKHRRRCGCGRLGDQWSDSTLHSLSKGAVERCETLPDGALWALEEGERMAHAR